MPPSNPKSAMNAELEENLVLGQQALIYARNQIKQSSNLPELSNQEHTERWNKIFKMRYENDYTMLNTLKDLYSVPDILEQVNTNEYFYKSILRTARQYTKETTEGMGNCGELTANAVYYSTKNNPEKVVSLCIVKGIDHAVALITNPNGYPVNMSKLNSSTVIVDAWKNIAYELSTENKRRYLMPYSDTVFDENTHSLVPIYLFQTIPVTKPANQRLTALIKEKDNKLAKLLGALQRVKKNNPDFSCDDIETALQITADDLPLLITDDYFTKKIHGHLKQILARADLSGLKAEMENALMDEWLHSKDIFNFNSKKGLLYLLSKHHIRFKNKILSFIENRGSKKIDYFNTILEHGSYKNDFIYLWNKDEEFKLKLLPLIKPHILSQLEKKLLDDKEESLFTSSTFKKHHRVIEYLFTHNIFYDSNIQLMEAARCGNSHVIQLLLGKGAKAHSPRDQDNLTPLTLAAQNGHFDAINLLLSNNGQINFPRTDGATALYMACKNGHLKVAELLLQHNATVDATLVSENKSPLHAAAEYGHEAIVELLIHHGAQVDHLTTTELTALIFAAHYGHLNVVKLLITKAADVNKASTEQTTPLLVASKNGHVDIVCELLKQGALPDLIKTMLKNPLFMAAAQGHEQVVALLMSYGANVSFAFPCDETMLRQLAQQLGVESSMEHFIARKQRKGLQLTITATEIAAINGFSRIVGMLNCPTKPKHLAQDRDEKSPQAVISCSETNNYQSITSLIKHALSSNIITRQDAAIYVRFSYYSPPEEHEKQLQSIVDDLNPCLAHNALPLIKKVYKPYLAKLKTQLIKEIKATIINRVENHDKGLVPWSLGLFGSRFAIHYKGKIQQVPKGVYQIWQLVSAEKPLINNIDVLNEIHKLCHAKKEHSFFDTLLNLIGFGRFEETSMLYNEIDQMTSAKIGFAS